MAIGCALERDSVGQMRQPRARFDYGIDNFSAVQWKAD